MSSAVPLGDERKSGSATAEGTLRYAARFQGRAAAGHFREIRGGLVLSSIGIGTYLGEPDEATDGAYTDAVVTAIEGGINVVDSAINYRFQRSERAVGAALRELFHKGFGRDEVMVCTKAGFLTPDGEMPADPNTYFSSEFLERGVFAWRTSPPDATAWRRATWRISSIVAAGIWASIRLTFSTCTIPKRS